MRAEEAVVQALARAGTVSDTVPATRSLYYRRLGVRQQELFARAAVLAPDFYGTCAKGALIDGAADFADMQPPVMRPEAITRVEISDGGESEYEPGTRVRMVRLGEEHAAEKPRAVIRDRVFRSVGSDLDGVAEIMVYYPRSPEPIGPDGKDVELEIPAPFDELLVIDLARYALSKTLDIEPETRVAAIQALSEEEAALLAQFDAHVRNYAPLEARFGGG